MHITHATTYAELPPRPIQELVTVHSGEIVGNDGIVAEVEINLPKIVKREKARGLEVFTVRSRTSSKTYSVTRYGHRGIKLSCDCPAGVHGRGCHHKKSVRDHLFSESNNTPKSRETIRRESGGFAVEVPYHQRHLAKQHGGFWDSASKRWLMPSRATAEIVRASIK